MSDKINFGASQRLHENNFKFEDHYLEEEQLKCFKVC